MLTETRPETQRPKTRSQYVDTLRAMAIARVYLHHTLWIGWMTMLFPSMPIMFALAGFLAASSLDRAGAAHTVWSRVRRLLPPLWGLALVAVPLMLIQGWSGIQWSELLYWVVPLANPITNESGGAFAMALWYLRAYLWFILLAPVLWWAFKRWPLVTMATPLAVSAILYSPLVNLPPMSEASDVISSTAFYGTAWVLGYARYSGLLDRVPWKVCGAIAAGLAAAGFAWGLMVVAPAQSPLVDPIAEQLWSTGFVLVLMRLRPRMDWLERFPRVRKVIGALNARAVTIYIWHLPVLLGAGTIVGAFGLDPLHDSTGKAVAIALGTVLLGLIVLLLGWIEDVAARRRPSVLPI